MKSSKLIFSVACLILFAVIFVACGDESSEQVNNVAVGVEAVSSLKDLPDCTQKNEGNKIWVKNENSARVCVDEKWRPMNGSNSVAADYGCETRILPDSSGFAVYCAGDSIGVVLNGKDGSNGAKGDKGDPGKTGTDGEKGDDGKDGTPGSDGAKGDDGQPGENGINGIDGKDGVGCEIVSQTNYSVTVKCGDDQFEMGVDGFDLVNVECDDESDVDCSVSLDDVKISGTSQKGPFINGTSVIAYELTSNLKQTGNSYSGFIRSNDGLFNISSVRLASQYVYLLADGFYRNEVTGKNNTYRISLRALANLMRKEKANINLITHLEYDRVNYLVNNKKDPKTGKKYKVMVAKRLAESEIFNAFHIDDSKFEGRNLENLESFIYAEDMNILEEGEGNGALLAISTLLQGNRSESELVALLSDFSFDLLDDGQWNTPNAEKTRGTIAKWAADVELGRNGRPSYDKIRENVKGWNLGDVPAFEKYMQNFWWSEYGLGSCGSEENPVGTVKNSSNCNGLAKEDCATEYLDVSYSSVRFTCVDSSESGVGKVWREATEYEEDTFGWHCAEGFIVDEDELIIGTNRVVGQINPYNFYECNQDNEIILVRGRMQDLRDGQYYKMAYLWNQWWLTENLNYEYNDGTAQSFCYDDKTENCETYGHLYTWSAAVDSAAKFSTTGRGCGYLKICYFNTKVRGVCPEGWHLPSVQEWERFIRNVGTQSGIKLRSTSGWRDGENGTDEYGFTVLPAGMRGHYAEFDFWQKGTGFWASTGNTGEDAALAWVDYAETVVSTLQNNYDKRDSYSVRCVKDE